MAVAALEFQHEGMALAKALLEGCSKAAAAAGTEPEAAAKIGLAEEERCAEETR